MKGNNIQSDWGSCSDSLLIVDRYSLSGHDNYGYTMLHQAIAMAESIGIVNNTRMINLKAPHLTSDMKRSLQRTAWGLFQIDTCVHPHPGKVRGLMDMN